MNLGSPVPSAEDSGGQKPYAEYKDSGIGWLPEIPASWKAKRLRFLCRINPPKSEIANLPPDFAVSFLPMERVSEDGRLDLEESRLLDDVRGGYTYFRNGDIVVAKITPCFENGKGAIGADLLNGIGFGTTEFHVLRPSNAVDPSFLFYLTKCHPFRTMGAAMMTGAAGQKRVPESFLRDLWLGLPPVDEQRAIVAFLDRETAKIDAMIVKKERLIALLEEKQAALISHAVTKGLDPTAPMKDTGIDWLGSIPAHWDVKRLVHLTDPNCPICYGILLPGPKLDEGVPYIGAGDVIPERLTLASLPRTTPEISAEYSRSVVKAGELVYAIRGSFGNVEVVPEELDGANLSRDAARIVPRSEVHNRWLAYALKSRSSQEQFGFHEIGATITGVNIGDLRRVLLPVPPPSEQRQLAAFLDDSLDRLGAVVRRCREAILKLQEYRMALVSAAVTGKIDVRASVEAETPQRQANVHFLRSVAAAEIASRLHAEPTFGRIKLQKLLHLCENHIGMELAGEYKRKAAGPFDNRMMHSVESQMEKQGWFRAEGRDRRIIYVPLAKAGGHREYFQRYWGSRQPAFDALINLLRRADTRQCEIVSTLYAVWNDLLLDGGPCDDDAIVREVLTNWHPKKQRIPEENWRTALVWMRQHGLVPTGRGQRTYTVARPSDGNGGRSGNR